MVGKSVTFGHGIAIDAAHGVFLLAAAFTLRRASSVALFCSVMLRVDVRRLALSSCLSSGDIFFLLSLCRAFLSSSDLFCRVALLSELISSFSSSVKLFWRACQDVRCRSLSSCLFSMDLFSRAALLCLLISSFCAAVKLFRRALSRSQKILIKDYSNFLMQ